MTEAQLELPYARAYCLSGRATVTLHNPASGGRYTYRIDARRGDAFVALLTGPDNVGDYQYLGILRRPQFDELVLTRRSCASARAPSVRAFRWVWRRLTHGADLAGVEVLHQGTCGRCGHALTTPDSIARGLGPVCAVLLGVA